MNSEIELLIQQQTQYLKKLSIKHNKLFSGNSYHKRKRHYLSKYFNKIAKYAKLFDNSIEFHLDDNTELTKRLIEKLKTNLETANNLTRREEKLLLASQNFLKENTDLYLDILRIVKNRIYKSHVSALFKIFIENYKFIMHEQLEIRLLFQKIFIKSQEFYKGKVPQTRDYLYSFLISSPDYLNDNFVSQKVSVFFQALEYKPEYDFIREIKKISFNLTNSSLYHELLVTTFADERFINLLKNDKYITLFKQTINEPIEKDLKDRVLTQILYNYRNADDNSLSLVQQNLKKIILECNYYRDPRVFKDNWKNIPQEATQIFKSWILKDRLEFWFANLFQDTQGRKKFWFRFTESVLDYCVFVAQDDWKSKLESAIAETNFQDDYKKLVTSCQTFFILEIHNYYIVEFGQDNNATYFYRKEFKSFDFQKDDYTAQSIKISGAPNAPTYVLNSIHRNDCFRISHQAGWQQHFESVLAEIGEYPNERK
jgi:hypothetical protein